MSIYTKLVQVQQEAPSIKKNGVNTFHKYKYVTEADILATIGPLLAKHGIAHFVTVTDSKVERGSASVTVQLTLVDSEKPEDTIVTQSYGYSEDVKGDKAVYKAITGATKYAYLKTFGLSTDDDSENETHEEAQAKGAFRTPVKPPAPPADDSGAKRQQMLQQIGILFKKHEFSREDFPEFKGIQTPEQATNDELEHALAAVREAAKKCDDLKDSLKGVA